MSSPLRISLVITLLSFALAADAQKLLMDYDSLAITKPRPGQPTYMFPSPGIGTSTLVYKTPFSTELPMPKRPFEGFLTLVTGIGTGTSDSSNFLGTHEIKVDDPLKNWRVHLYCNGMRSTDRERVKDADGYSVNKVKSVRLDWSSNARGFLLEQTDTVGLFLIIREPRIDKQMAPWITFLELRYEVPRSATGPAAYPFAPFRDYALYGKLRDKFFYVVASGNRFVSLILFDEKPVGLFRSDFNHVVRATKKWSYTPYLLVDKSLEQPARDDVMRLAMLSWVTMRSLSVSYFEE
jgi:hypothetical protein